MADSFTLKIKSPLERIELNEVKSVVIETADGQTEFLANHTNLASFIIFGKCTVFLEGEEIIYKVFKGSIFFDEENNTLNLLCLEFSISKEYKFNFEEILEALKESESEIDSPYKLKYLDDLRISLIIEDEDKTTN